MRGVSWYTKDVYRGVLLSLTIWPLAATASTGGTMYLDTNNGWFARWREHRRVERQQACERERRGQEQLDQILADYPVDRSPHAKTRTSSDRGLAGHVSGGGGGFWSGFGGDCDGGGGFWSSFGGDWGGGDGGGC